MNNFSYNEPHIVARDLVCVDEAILMGVTLAYNNYRPSQLVLHIEEIDPLMRSMSDKDDVWHRLAETLHDVVHKAEPGYKNPITFIVPQNVAKDYDDHLRDVFMLENSATLMDKPMTERHYIYR